MKTKTLLLAALVSAAALSANAGVRFGFSFGLPVPVVVPAPVVVVAPPVVLATPVVVAAVPPCPGVGYVWAPGYWAYRSGGRVWVAGSWGRPPVYAARSHFYGGRRW